MAVAFAKAIGRRFWEAAFLASALHIAIAFGAGFYFSRPQGDPWRTSALFYGGFLALSLVWWVTRQFVDWLVWRVIWHKAAVNDLVAAFGQAALPRPPAMLPSAEDYFSDVVGDENCDFNTRLSAAAHYLRITEFAGQQGFLASLRFARLYEESIGVYRSSVRN